MLITFEGIDGAGKTTQAKRLCEHLRGSGRKAVLYREPGGVPVSEKLREILMLSDLTLQAELFLFEAARAELVHRKIKPDLQAGFIVILDRFTDSTLAYQGYGRGIDLRLIKELNDFATSGLRPDVTFLLDIDPLSALKRLVKKSRFEDPDFLERVRRGYLEIAEENPERVVVIPSHPPTEEVFAQIWRFLRERFDF